MNLFSFSRYTTANSSFDTISERKGKKKCSCFILVETGIKHLSDTAVNCYINFSRNHSDFPVFLSSHDKTLASACREQLHKIYLFQGVYMFAF